MIVLIDNYDSFVENLARYLREAGAQTQLVRNDAKTVSDVLAMDPLAIVISPGPKAPRDAGICLDLIDALPTHLPLLGVCLGHQCLVEALGGETQRAAAPLHGAASEICHDGVGIFKDLPSPFMAGRYHSLISKLPDSDELAPTGWTKDGALMAVQHASRPWFGVQFHPESLLTPFGKQIIRNFIDLIG